MAILKFILIVIIGSIILGIISGSPDHPKKNEQHYSKATPIDDDITEMPLSPKETKTREKALYEKVRKLPAANIEGNLKLYKELVKLNPSKKLYKDKVAHYKNKLKMKKFDENIYNEASNCFVDTEVLLERSLRDPDSYDRIKWGYWQDQKGEVKIWIKYRARNGFGGYSFGKIVTACDYRGRLKFLRSE